MASEFLKRREQGVNSMSDEGAILQKIADHWRERAAAKRNLNDRARVHMNDECHCCGFVNKGDTGLCPECLEKTSKAVTEAASLRARIEVLEGALRRIETWHGEFPPTGRYWDKEQREPMSYGAAFGSNGERDFIREIARKALSPTSSDKEKK